MKKLVFLAVMVAASSYATDLYVDAAGGNDENDGLSWETAKASIQAAINIVEANAATNALVLVTNGRYTPIVATNKIPFVIRSVNGPEATVIDASLQWPGGSTNRCATLGTYPHETNSVLSGFRLTNGITDFYGGGSYAGTLTNCVLSGNTANSFGGGAHGPWTEEASAEIDSDTGAFSLPAGAVAPEGRFFRSEIRADAIFE